MNWVCLSVSVGVSFFVACAVHRRTFDWFCVDLVLFDTLVQLQDVSRRVFGLCSLCGEGPGQVAVGLLVPWSIVFVESAERCLPIVCWHSLFSLMPYITAALCVCVCSVVVVVVAVVVYVLCSQCCGKVLWSGPSNQWKSNVG